MVTQPSTSHHMLCVQYVSVCVRVLLCLVFILAVHLSNCLPVITADITGHSKFCNATQTILNPSVPETRNFSSSSHPLFVIVVILIYRSRKDGSLSLAVCPGSWTSDLLHGHARMNVHARCERVGALTNWASKADSLITITCEWHNAEYLQFYTS